MEKPKTFAEEIAAEQIRAAQGLSGALRRSHDMLAVGDLAKGAAKAAQAGVGVESEQVRVDNLLAVLRKHGVAEYKQGNIHVRFYAEPTVEEAGKVIARELERVSRAPTRIPADAYSEPPLTPEQAAAFAKRHAAAPGFSPPTAPEPGAVEPTRLDLQDALFGAK